MEQKIIDTANKYKELALMLENFEMEQPIDEDTPEEAQTALIKLYYAKAFEEEIEKCEDLLEEDTDEETVNAVTESSSEIDNASESAFGVIEEFYYKDKEFSQRIDGITVSTETEGILVKLIKLYKCEEIIRKAYGCSMRIPLYGSLADSSNWQREEDVVILTREQEITRKLGIDMDGLYELRQRLVKEIGSIIERKATAL